MTAGPKSRVPFGSEGFSIKAQNMKDFQLVGIANWCLTAFLGQPDRHFIGRMYRDWRTEKVGKSFGKSFFGINFALLLIKAPWL